MIPIVSSKPLPEPRAVWGFWLACGLAAAGGAAPYLLSLGSSSRISGVIVPFAIGAVALGLDALMHQRGRMFAALVYLVAGLAIAYGILAMFAVVVQLTILGTCPPAPASCASGLQRALSNGEANSFTIALVAGVLALLFGFFGLLMYFRRTSQTPAP
jgi:hypothetical protein